MLINILELITGLTAMIPAIYCCLCSRDLEAAILFIAAFVLIAIGAVNLDQAIERKKLVKKVRKEHKKHTVVWMDMDGVLCKWEDAPVEMSYKEGFFLEREADEKALALLNALKDSGMDVRILSNAYENGLAAPEKLKWLCSQGLSDLQICLVPYGTDKAAFVKDRRVKNILIDDYTKNLNSWEKNGFLGLKWYNGFNGRKGSWERSNRPAISNRQSVNEMVRTIRKLAVTA